MTDDEIRRLGEVIADEVCRQTREEIENTCLSIMAIVLAFWIVKITIAAWQLYRIDR